MLQEYQELLKKKTNFNNITTYLDDPYLQRLKDVGYFCGMDYASKDIYQFREYISRYDHSINVALITSLFTDDKNTILAGLYHDIATPCFSHVIDYMNKDYIKQESTEDLTSYILEKDTFLKDNNININEISNFKKYSIVDNERPYLCADRIDGIILNSIGWTKNIDLLDIYQIINDLELYNNEFNQKEIGFKTPDIADKTIKLNDIINNYMHSKEDIYMMELLANIIKYSLYKKYLYKEDLYNKSEKEILSYLSCIEDNYLINNINLFKNIQKEDIANNSNIMIKNRNLKPLVRGRRVP